MTWITGLFFLLTTALGAESGYQVTLDGETLTESAVETDGQLFVPLKDLARSLHAELKLVPEEGRAELSRKDLGHVSTEEVVLDFDSIRDISDSDERGRRIALALRVTNITKEDLRFYPELSHVQLHDQFEFSYEGEPILDSQADYIILRSNVSQKVRWTFSTSRISRGNKLVFRVVTDQTKHGFDRPPVRMVLPERPASSP